MSTQRAFFPVLVLALGGVALAACVVTTTSGSTRRSNPRPGPTPPPPPSDGAPGGAGAIGQTCEANDACAEGLECMRSADGSKPSTCERRCSAGCRQGTQCVTIADGPGDVCRPTSDAGSIGEPCGAGDACAEGLECMRSADGSKPSTCERRCSAGCRQGTQCVTIADGPGDVCRPTSDAGDIGEPCGAGDACAAGLECMRSADGSKPSTCERRCSAGCRQGTQCVTIADGPGDVCRPTSDAGDIGEPCGAGDTCAEGLECMRYYGIAGANGPEFASCERRCSAGCRRGTQCVTISDGPGAVCRP